MSGIARGKRIGLGRHGRIEENAGDPLDGLVNLFDIGIVLAVAFLIAGLTLAVDPDSGEIVRRGSIERRAEAASRPGVDPAEDRARVLPAPREARIARGRGAPVGTAYRLADGRIVIVR